MPQLPACDDARYEEMVCCAMEAIRESRDDLGPTDPEWIISKLRYLLRAGAKNRQAIIARAKAGDVLMHEALMREVDEMLDNNEMPPASLRVYATERHLHPKRRKGVAWWVNFRRDFMIARLIDAACEAYGITATRSPCSSKHCAAEVVAEALKRSGYGRITEKAVANMWGRPPLGTGSGTSSECQCTITPSSSSRSRPLRGA
jgi:hypothetical protein